MTARPRRVVYTCLFGYYDALMEPAGSNRDQIDFICFTDRDDLVSGGWQIRPLNSMFLGRGRASRLAKLAPTAIWPNTINPCISTTASRS